MLKYENKEADKDKDGFISFEEFYKVMRRGNLDPLLFQKIKPY